MLEENLSQTNRTISINLDECTFKKIQNHAMQNGEDINKSLSLAISEAVDLWDDYDKIISTMNIKERLPFF